MSTGYWLLGEDLHLKRKEWDGEVKLHYISQKVEARYVGVDKEIPKINAGTLVRVSLARWWSEDPDANGEPRCYLQISGWYE